MEAKTGVKLPQMYNESNVNLLDVAIREKKKTQLWKDAPVSALAHTSFTSQLLDVMLFCFLTLLLFVCVSFRCRSLCAWGTTWYCVDWWN